MADPGFGRNRLATGFVKPQVNHPDSKSSDDPTSLANFNNVIGESSASPIEISDDEMADSEGGMVINIDQYSVSAQPQSSSESESEESGEILSTPKNIMSLQKDTTDLLIIDSTPTLPVKRLVDLTADEMEDQLRYAFYHLGRDQIDLSRPVLCLACATEGHLHSDCKQQGTDLFPVPKIDSASQVKLWISCCSCGSRSHLVGDCPQMEYDGAARWSLKALPAEQIINLNLEKGISMLEKEAENAGMRPAGLQIKGRAGLHRSGIPQSEGSNEDEDEPFLRKPVGRQGQIRTERSQAPRYDRFNPPSNHQSTRGGNGGQWYQTDSFGRRRSRSPDNRYDTYRPRDDYSRSRMSPQRDSWRPPTSNEPYRDTYRPRLPSPRRENVSTAPTNKSKGSQGAKMGSNVKFSLPTRKGSNTWLQGEQSGGSTPSSNGKAGDSQHSKRRKNKGKGPKNGRPN